ncbi:hypothetical protein Egran_02860 [Elaphomyces granulatus]|uniref:Uncharacterized protein n=1 Tax=Elaphomyces granulatus TaxID=519963 RepID=A0A232LZW6_9EURO|nr:hypothetical protein Egran_02860 [Elaphomyces granulatus]
MFPLVVRFRNKPSYNVHFVYDTDSPFTFLSKELCNKLFVTNTVSAQFPIEINWERIMAHPPNSSSHFAHVNLLGADFCAL